MFRIIAVCFITALVVCLVLGVHVLEDDTYWNMYHPPDDDDGCSLLKDGDDHAKWR